MNIARSDQRILIDASVSEYAALIAAALDLAGQSQGRRPQPLHVAQPVSVLLAAHREFAELEADRPAFVDELVGAESEPPLVVAGQGSYAHAWADELVGAPVAAVTAERVRRSAYCLAHSS